MTLLQLTKPKIKSNVDNIGQVPLSTILNPTRPLLQMQMSVEFTKSQKPANARNTVRDGGSQKYCPGSILSDLNPMLLLHSADVAWLGGQILHYAASAHLMLNCQPRLHHHCSHHPSHNHHHYNHHHHHHH